jgi:UDP-N-acetylmuramoyl-tripeptide--D-alanyl-D-alanine ligase
MLETLNNLFYALFLLSIGYYFILNLQWYSYKLNRVLFHHSKAWWHFVYFLLPFFLYGYISGLGDYGFVLVIVYMGLLGFWYRGLDKPLVWTGRIKRFYSALVLFALFLVLVFGFYSIVIPLFLSYAISIFIEKMLFTGFKNKAELRLEAMENLIVIGITASYGKTSIKNYIEHLLKAKYKTYATPRSVNTLGGIVLDINRDLPSDTQVYIVEMGARGQGDIAEISSFVNPHYVIVGKIGPAHIEYFRTMENIRNTKMEILQSERLKEAWIHESAMVKREKNIHTFGTMENYDIRSNIQAPEYILTDIKATLDSTNFILDDISYEASILGAFNAMNLAVSVLVAQKMDLEEKEIQKGLKSLKSVAHRLQRIDAGGKIILDDSFNGNIDGMMASFYLASTHQGRKVLITAGLVEVDEAQNIEVARIANKVFDIIVVTSDINEAIYKANIHPEKFSKLEDKSKMQEMLIEKTQGGDLILFANDAPSFI